MADRMTPQKRAEEIVAYWIHCTSSLEAKFIRDAIAAALQAQSNADEERHREKQAALRAELSKKVGQLQAAETLFATQAKRADELQRVVNRYQCDFWQLKGERDAAQARAAELRRALEGMVGYVTNLQPPRDEALAMARAALSQPPGEWLERVKREARIEALEALPCEFPHPDDWWCPRCRALDEAKGGRG